MVKLYKLWHQCSNILRITNERFWKVYSEWENLDSFYKLENLSHWRVLLEDIHDSLCSETRLSLLRSKMPACIISLDLRLQLSSLNRSLLIVVIVIVYLFTWFLCIGVHGKSWFLPVTWSSCMGRMAFFQFLGDKNFAGKVERSISIHLEQALQNVNTRAGAQLGRINPALCIFLQIQDPPVWDMMTCISNIYYDCIFFFLFGQWAANLN